MNRVLWRLREVRPDEWWVVDEPNGTAYGVERSTAERLWAADRLLTEPLDSAIRLAAIAPERSSTFVDLRFLGLTIRYRSSLAHVVERVRTDFAGAHAILRHSPDVLVELAPETDVTLLHRSVPAGHAGVSVRSTGESELVASTGDFPIVPPLAHPHFRGHTSLHAALLATAAGNVIVCGARRSGKTTAAVTSAGRGAARILTDEIVLLDAMGCASGVGLPVRERTPSSRTARPLARQADGSTPVDVSSVVVLEPAETAPGTQRVADVADALRLLAPHVRPLAGPLGVASDNLLALVRRSTVWRWALRPWPAMVDDIASALDTTLAVAFDGAGDQVASFG